MRKQMDDTYVPPRYRVRLSADFKPEPPTQVEVYLSPSGIFGIQDGLLRRNEAGQDVLFDQKTGDFIVRGSGGELITLDPISLEDLRIGIGPAVNLEGNRLTWTQPTISNVDVNHVQQAIGVQIHRLLAVLPVLSYQRVTP